MRVAHPDGKPEGVVRRRTQWTDHTSILCMLCINLPHHPSKALHRPLARKDTTPKLLAQPALPQQSLDAREIRHVGRVLEDGDEGGGEEGGGRGEVGVVGVCWVGLRF